MLIVPSRCGIFKLRQVVKEKIMKLIMPSYCKNFKCTANNCKDNCCIGWEIDIDEETKTFYDSVNGPFKEKLTSGIADGETPCFKLKNERCAFLNDKNLCEIYINLGEKHLCQICRDHPRYYEWFRDRIEGGTGLCCEESARLILTSGTPFSFYAIEKDDEPLGGYDKDEHDFLFSLRERFFEILENENISLSKKLHIIYNEIADADDFAEPFDIGLFFDALYSLEEMGCDWKTTAEKLKKQKDEIKSLLPIVIKEYEKEFTNLAVYFIWRYLLKSLFDGMVKEKIYLLVFFLLAVACVFALQKLQNKSAGLEELITLAKNCSKQIEYSEENLLAIEEFSFDETVSIEKLLSALM